MKIIYFAWLREHVGKGAEDITCPSDVKNVDDLVNHLQNLSEGHAKALQDMSVVRVAVNHVYGDLSTTIKPNDEVAFFPPVTGG